MEAGKIMEKGAMTSIKGASFHRLPLFIFQNI